MRTIFVVEDNKNILRTITKILSKTEGAEVRGFSSPTLALLEAEKEKPDVIVTDLMMPGMTGIDLVRALRKEGINSQVIFITGHVDVLYKQLLPENRVRSVIEKPLSLMKVQKEVTEALKMKTRHGPSDTQVLKGVEA